jgi:acyl-CoA hydrolase
MNLSELYRQKLTTAERAVDGIRSGDRVYVHAGCATPAVLTEALLERAGALHDVEIIHLLTFGNADYTLPQYDDTSATTGCSSAPTWAKPWQPAAPTTRRSC